MTTQPQQTFEKTAFHRLFPASLLLSLAALAAVAPLATDMYLPAFTAMAKDMGVGASTVQLTMTAFLVGIAIGQLGIGILSDRLGRRPLLVWGTILALAAGIAAAAAPDIAVLLIARFFQGLGERPAWCWAERSSRTGREASPRPEPSTSSWPSRA